MDLRDLRDIDNLCCLGLLFVGGGIAGWIYEMLFYRINDGMFVERGQGLGPWLPIYGAGGALATGWVFYTFFNGLRLWDYNTEIWNWGNINGYICLRSILLFAFGGLFLVYIAVPLIRALSSMVPKTLFRVISLLLPVLFLIDIVGGYVLKIW